MLKYLQGWMGRLRLGRPEVARLYLRGDGLEIGALHRPLRLPAAARVTYVDRLSVSELRRHYPELADKTLVPVGLIDDGERLTTVADGSQDFVVANHFLEHCEDPIGAVQSFLRVLRPGGVAYLTVPDMRFTFDRPRTPTPLAHLLEDHASGTGRSRRAHYEEWVTAVEGNAGPGAAARAEALMRHGYSIHFHAWTPAEWLELLAWVRREWPCEVELLLRRKGEMLTILRKGSAELPIRVVPATVA